MAKTYIYTEARQNLANILAQAEKDGEVRITHRSGKVFVLRPDVKDRSPLDVPGVGQEVLDSIRERRVLDIWERRSSYKTI